MEKYIDRSSIVSLEIYEKKLVDEYYRVYKKPWKLLGLIPITKEKWIYQKSPIYSSSRCHYNSIEEAYSYEYGLYGYKYILDDNKVYRKPYVNMLDKNNRAYVKFFDTEKEVDEYIRSLDLDIVKKYVKLKFD